MWRIGWAPNNTSKRQMGFNSEIKALILVYVWKYRVINPYPANVEKMVN
jgi:hypothetical protein